MAVADSNRRSEREWYFDTAKGKEEILTRRIGSNELDAIEVCRGFVEAQSDYATQNRTANNLPVYAQKIISSPGRARWVVLEGQRREQRKPDW